MTQRWPEAIPNVNSEVNTVTLDRQVSAYLYRDVKLDYENFNLWDAFHFIFAFYLTFIVLLQYRDI